MTFTLADAPAALPLLSYYKPLVLLAVLAGFAYLITKLDKDAGEFLLPRVWWNSAHMGTMLLAAAAWLLVPWNFYLGLTAALVIIGGDLAGYTLYRNAKVAPESRWTGKMDTLKRGAAEARTARAQLEATLRICRPDGTKLEVPGPDTPQGPVHARWQEVFDFALPRHADRVDLVVAGADQTALVVHIDGVKYAQPKPDGRLAMGMIEYLKEHSGLDVADRRRRQTGDALIEAEGQGRHRLIVVAAGSTREMSLSVRIDRDKQLALPLDKIGLLPLQVQQLKPALATGKGIVLVACPQHAGMTTTLYALLHQHDPYTQSVSTLEDPIEFPIEGANQAAIEPGSDGTAVAKRVTVLMRSDPQVFMLSRITDPQVVAALTAPTTGAMRCYAGLRMNNTFSALGAWIKLVGDPQQAAAALTAIVSQRLVRKLCPTCRVGFTPDPAALKKLNLPAQGIGTLYKPSGQVMIKNKPVTCPACLGMAYRGRVGVFEVMVLDDEARELIGAGQLEPLRAHLRKNKMKLMQEAALDKVVAGVTSIAEISRALAEKEA
jgi:type II secretory ATPase GspE/PulE/Tfp pilus assembly ATPase PilB-like protein